MKVSISWLKSYVPIEMDVDDLSWPVMFLAAINAKVHHTEPPELRTLLQQLAEHFRATA